MSVKDMHRSDWKRVTNKSYVSKDIIINELRGKISLLRINEVSAPLTIHNIAGRVLIADKGISWLQIALENKAVWITAMYDAHDDFIQAYFDITNGNCFENPDNPVFEDMYLDVVLNKKLEIHTLDEDELEEALAAQRITVQQYESTQLHCEALIRYLQEHTDSFLQYCRNAYFELKQLIP